MAYDMRISDWSSDVCSSDLRVLRRQWNVCSATKRSARGRGAVQRFVHASGAHKAVAVRVAAAVPERVAERHGPAIGQHVFGITVEIERVVVRLLRSVVIQI